MIALLALAVAVAAGNFATAIGIGVSGVSGRTRARVAVVFFLFEAGMPVAGLALGQGLAGTLGHLARWLAAAVLIAVGTSSLAQAWRQHRAGPASASGPQRYPWRLGRLAVSGLALSADNLAAGFALSAYRTPLLVAAVVFGLTSVVVSLAGLELGAKIGRVAGDRSEFVAGAMLIAVGAVIAAGAL